MKHCSGPRLASGSVLQNVFQRMSAVRGSILVMGLLLVGQTAFAEAAAPGGPLDGKIQRDNQHTERRLAQTEVATPTVSGTITIIYEKPKDVPPPRPLLSVSVTPSPPTFSVGDQTITYNYVIKNTGQGSAATLVLRDSKATDIQCGSRSIAPGSSVTCTGNYTTTQLDVGNDINNTAVVRGTSLSGDVESVAGRATVAFVGRPELSLSQTCSPLIYTQAGQTIVCNFAVTNTGNVPVDSCQITGSRVNASCPQGTILIGGSVPVKGVYTTTAADVGNNVEINVTLTGLAGRLRRGRQATTLAAFVAPMPVPPVTGTATIVYRQPYIPPPPPPPPPPKGCPEGKVRFGVDCVAVTDPAPKCEKGYAMRNGDCVEIQSCPRGTVKRGSRCVEVVENCERGYVRKGRRCVRVAENCKRGYVREGRRCVRVVRDCGRGAVWRGDHCEDVPRGPSGPTPGEVVSTIGTGIQIFCAVSGKCGGGRRNGEGGSSFSPPTGHNDFQRSRDNQCRGMGGWCGDGCCRPGGYR